MFIILAIYVACTALAVVLEPFADLPCDQVASDTKFPNVFYKFNPCRDHNRYARLMGLTQSECRFGRHMVVAIILGMAIGYERRSADRPAGIRTMGVVALAACLFTLNSTFVFMNGPMHWDPARVSAAVPTGVGFLGAGLMVQDIIKDDFTGQKTHSVRGINTAASVWLSAAVGVACGGGQYFVAIFTSMLLMVLLRFGPRTEERLDSVLGKENLESSVLPISAPIPYSFRASAPSAKRPSMHFH